MAEKKVDTARFVVAFNVDGNKMTTGRAKQLVEQALRKMSVAKVDLATITVDWEPEPLAEPVEDASE